VEFSRLVHQLGGLCLPKYVTSTEYTSVIKTRNTGMEMAWGGKLKDTPMQQHPWSRKGLREGDKYSQKTPNDAFCI
jgi:hypothetical protein